MVDVAVIMSTYNGANNIVRQLDSIFAQKEVDVTVVIRDDNSRDNTVEVVDTYRKNKNAKIILLKGANKGYAHSFMTALRRAGDFSYYAFADQDDLWCSDKLIKSINAMDKDAGEEPQLSYCRMTRTNSSLIEQREQVCVLTPEELSKKLVLTQTFNYGAATVLNKSAKELVCRHFPANRDVPHDMWCGLLCYWFGKIHYVNESLYYWIRYESSVTGEGTRFSGARYRIKETLKGKSYVNVAEALLDHYSDLISQDDEMFLKRMCDYKINVRSKISLIWDTGFRRRTMAGTVMLKLGIAFNKL